MAAGAYRGYGATQGTFAVETSVNELAEKLGMDPMEIRMKNMVKEGQFMPAYYGETANSCALDKCLARVKEMSGWDEKYPRKVMPDGKIRSVGDSTCHAGILHFQCRCRICNDQTGRGWCLQYVNRGSGHGNRV